MDPKSELDAVRVLRKYDDGVCIDFRYEFKTEEEGPRRFDGSLSIYNEIPSRTIFRREVKNRNDKQDHFIEEGEISPEINERLEKIPHYELIRELLAIKQQSRRPSG